MERDNEMKQETHLILTMITVYSTLISGLLLFIYMFIAFLFGYTVTFLEPNTIIASVELIWSLLVLLIIFNVIMRKIKILRINTPNQINPPYQILILQ
mgnify:CR=1 FL=1